MPHKELDRFPQTCRAELGHGLRVFLDGHMQGIAGSENLLGRDEAFKLGRGHCLDRFRVIRQLPEDLLRYPLRFSLVGKVF